MYHCEVPRIYTMIPVIFIVLAVFTQVYSTNVRLSGGQGPWEGRLEIDHDGNWGTVCDDGFGLNDAKVVCRMLGYQREIAVFSSTRFHSGAGRIMLDNVKCTGHEDDIANCPSDVWYKTDCDHTEDVGLNCVREGTEPVEGVRLIGGTGPYEGTVELNLNGVWGSVCDDQFDINDANIICRMAGYPRALQAFGGSYFGHGNGVVLLDELSCTGHEKSVDNCASTGWYKSDCDHTEDAGVACLGDQRGDTVQGVQLIGGTGPYEGTVELNINGVWGTVCDDHFDINDAQIICRMAGYPSALQYFVNSYFGRGNGSVLLDELSCSGHEKTLDNCGSRGWYISDCDHTEDAGVACESSDRSHPVEGVRLIGGTGPYEGTVEFNVNGVWGTVCDDHFDINDAQTICKMAGYPRALQAFVGSFFGRGNGSVLLDELQCTGRENNVDNCGSRGWYSSDCNHDEDAGIACLGSNRTHAVEGVRLVGGSSPWEGRVELNVNGQWGTVCDDHFDVNDAKVICKMAEYSSKGNIQVFTGHFGAGKGNILLDELQCQGFEDNIEDCSSRGWYTTDCDHDEDVGISCRDNGPVVG